MMFLAGLLDWHSPELPTSNSIAGATCLRQSQVHIRAITRTGGKILGFRELSADRIKPWLFRGAEFWRNSQVHLGLIPVRAQTPGDNRLPVLSTSGYDVARLLAEDRFVTNSHRKAIKLDDRSL
jgi:hypothetical protein